VFQNTKNQIPKTKNQIPKNVHPAAWFLEFGSWNLFGVTWRAGSIGTTTEAVE
jgi:hypothetical protein